MIGSLSSLFCASTTAEVQAAIATANAAHLSTETAVRMEADRPAGGVSGLVVSLGRSAAGLARREFEETLVPRLQRELRTALNRTPVESLTTDRAVSVWNRLTVGPNERWIDIGTGNAESLGRLARRHRGEFIGIDKENSPPLLLEVTRGGPNVEALPNNARYVVLYWNRPGAGMAEHPRIERASFLPLEGRETSASQTHRSTLAVLGASSAAVVSLLFPYTEPTPQSVLGWILQGKAGDPLEEQLDTAILLLRPGGIGVAFVEASPTAEKKRVLERTLATLRARREIAAIQFTPQGLPADRLDLAPYAPANREGRPVDTKPLTDGRLVFFRRKAR